MTITFNAIRLHDLVYLNNGDDIDGWFLVTGVSQKVGFFTATQLGYDIRPVMVPSDRMGIVQKHIRAAAVPGAIEALERIENGVTTTDSYGTQMALSDWDMEDIARAALRAVRGEEISDETHRESVSASNKSHPD